MRWTKESSEFLDMLTPEAAELARDSVFMNYNKILELPAIFSQLGLELAGDICEECGAFVKPSLTPYGGGVISRGECECERKKREEAEAEARRKQQIDHRLKLIRECGIPIKLQEATFQNFRIKSWNQNLVEKAQSYITHFEEARKVGMGLTITGSPGIGKSHIAAAIAKELILKGYDDIRFTSVEEYLDDIKETFDDQHQGKKKAEIMKKVCECSLLIFDDLMANSSTEWALNMIEQVYNRRTSMNLPIITTTNYSEADLMERLKAAHQERLYSRLIGCSYVIDLGEQRDERAFNKAILFGDIL